MSTPQIESIVIPAEQLRKCCSENDVNNNGSGQNNLAKQKTYSYRSSRSSDCSITTIDLTNRDTKVEKKTLPINYTVIFVAIPCSIVISFAVFMVGLFIGPLWLVCAAAGLLLFTIILFCYLHITKQRIFGTSDFLKSYLKGDLPKQVAGYAYIDTCYEEAQESADMDSASLSSHSSKKSKRMMPHDEAIVGDDHYKINGILIVYTDAKLPTNDNVLPEKV